MTRKMMKGPRMERMSLMSMIHPLASTSMLPPLPLQIPLIEPPSHQKKKMESLLLLSRQLVVLLTLLLPLFPLAVTHHELPPLHFPQLLLTLQLNLLRLAPM